MSAWGGLEADLALSSVPVPGSEVCVCSLEAQRVAFRPKRVQTLPLTSYLILDTWPVTGPAAAPRSEGCDGREEGLLLPRECVAGSV